MRPAPPRSLNNAVMSAQLTREERGSDILRRKGEDGTFRVVECVLLGKKEVSGLKPERGESGGCPFVQT